MSTRPQLKPFSVITNGVMASNITSLPTIISNLTLIGYGLSWSGTSPIGTVSVQVSNDFSLNAEGAIANAGTWTTMTVNYRGSAVTTVPVSGNTGNGFIDIDASGAYAMRLIYTAGSGSGSLQCLVNAKVA